MKSLLLFIVFSLFSVSFSTAQMTDFHFNSGLLRDISVKNGIVAVLGGKTSIDNSGKSKNHATISIKKNGLWQNLPNTIVRNGIEEPIELSSNNKIQIDSKENIWISGRMGIYKFDGTKWNEYTFLDTLSNRISYSYMGVDKKDNIIVTALNQTTQEDKKEISEFLKFDNEGFSIVKTLTNNSLFSNVNLSLRGNNFVALNDGSMVLGHRSVYISEVTKFSPDYTPSSHHMVTFDQYRGPSEKYVAKIIQHSDGTIWFAHLGGKIFVPNGSDLEESTECCTGVSFTSDFENFNSLGKNNNFPGGDFPYATASIAELPNKDVLIITDEEKFGLYLFDYNSKNVSKIEKSNFYNNAKIILVNDNPTVQQMYQNYVEILQQDLQPVGWTRTNFQNLLIDNQGTIYMNFLGFLLEIPTKNVTSVDAGLEVTDALRVFPNPAESTIRIDGTKEILSVTATNILGNAVLLSSKGNNSFGISNLSTGLYTLLIQHLDGTVSRTLFVKK